MDPQFTPGINIAIKIPKSKYEATLAFYRETLKWEVEERPISHPTISRTHKLKFGSMVLWLDCVDNYTKAETWMELRTNDVPAATAYLEERGIGTCDEIEKIPEHMHWIMDPAGNVFILDKTES